MRVKLDEDLSPKLGELLTSYGHETFTVRGQGWGGLKDPELWPRVVAEGVFFITADKGFGDLRGYPPGSHAGIILLRADRNRPSELRSLLQAALRTHRLEDNAGCLIVVTSRSIRVRRPAGDGQ